MHDCGEEEQGALALRCAVGGLVGVGVGVVGVPVDDAECSVAPAEGVVDVLSVQIDSTHGPEFLYGEAQLSKYRAHLDWMERLALDPGSSREFIRDVAKQL